MPILANPQEGRHGQDFLVYGSLPHENGEGRQRFYDYLRFGGCQVITKRTKRLPDGSFKCNLDAELIMDAIDLSNEMRPDIVVIASGDGDFAPLATRLRRKGIRVEVASMGASLANEMKAAANGYIDLTEWANNCERTNAGAPELGGANVFQAVL